MNKGSAVQVCNVMLTRKVYVCALIRLSYMKNMGTNRFEARRNSGHEILASFESVSTCVQEQTCTVLDL